MHNTDIYTSIQKQYFQGIKPKAEALYDYAANGYKYGLPVTTLYHASADSTNEVDIILAGIHGEPVTVSADDVDHPDELFFAIKILP